jgi:hypothetical protein
MERLNNGVMGCISVEWRFSKKNRVIRSDDNQDSTKKRRIIHLAFQIEPFKVKEQERLHVVLTDTDFVDVTSRLEQIIADYKYPKQPEGAFRISFAAVGKVFTDSKLELLTAPQKGTRVGTRIRTCNLQVSHNPMSCAEKFDL